MFPKSLRMGKQDFQEIQGKKSDLYFSEPLLIVKYYKQPTLKLSVVISKESIKTATLRNKIKRRIRSLIRSRLTELKTGFYVIIVKKGLNKDLLNYEELSTNVNNFLSKILKP